MKRTIKLQAKNTAASIIVEVTADWPNSMKTDFQKWAIRLENKLWDLLREMNFDTFEIQRKK